MGLNAKNRKWVVGALLVGTLGGGTLVKTGIIFAGDGAKTGLEQIPKITPGLGGAIDSGGTLGSKGVDNLGKIQTSLNNLNAAATTTTAAAAAGATATTANPDS